MLQGWYWNYPKTSQGKWWCDTLAQKARQLSQNGINFIWLPPMSMPTGGSYSNGYDAKDLFDLGGSVPNVNTGFGNRKRIDKMIDSLDKYGIVPVADMVLNQRDGGYPEANVSVQGWVENFTASKHINNGDLPYPSDRYRLILPIGGTTGLTYGTYYFKIHSASQLAAYYNKPYIFSVWDKRHALSGTPVTELEPNGGADCSEPDNPVQIGNSINATIDNGGCGTDEFALTLGNPDFYSSGDTLFITISNENGDYGDQFIYGLWYSALSKDIHDQLIYQTYTDFTHVSSKRGFMHGNNFKPNGSPTCLCGDWDTPLFYYDYDQVYVPSTIDTLNVWTQWMMENVGVKGLRLDAVKNYSPAFTGQLFNYLNRHNDNPQMLVGEDYDFNATDLNNELNSIYSYMTDSAKNAMYVSLFDFSLQPCLRDACDAFGDDVRNVFNCGMHQSNQIYRKNIVTFVNNHDFRDSSLSVDWDPILAYTYIITNPLVGIPCIYWSDYYSVAHPSYYNDMNQLLQIYDKFIQGAQNIAYINNFNSPYYLNYSSGASSTSLIYQLANTNGTCYKDRDLIVAINFSGTPLAVDLGVTTDNPYHLQPGDTLVDLLGRSSTPIAMVNSSKQIHLELPSRDYSVWARVSALPNVTISADGNPDLCNGDSIELEVQNAQSCFSYQWLNDGSPIKGATNTTYYIKQAGTISCQISYCGGATLNTPVSNSFSITIHPQKPEIALDGSSLLCNTANVSYQWYYGTDTLNLNPLIGYTAQQISPAFSGYYIVKITDSSNCSNSSNAFQYTFTGLDNLSNSTWEIYPNPSQRFIVIKNEHEIIDYAEAENLLGEFMLKKEIRSREATLDISAIPTGMYLLKLFTNEGVKSFLLEKE